MFECYEFMKKSESHPINPVFFDVGIKEALQGWDGSSEVLVIHISRGMCLMQFLSLGRGIAGDQIPPVLVVQLAFAINILESLKFFPKTALR